MGGDDSRSVAGTRRTLQLASMCNLMQGWSLEGTHPPYGPGLSWVDAFDERHASTRISMCNLMLRWRIPWKMTNRRATRPTC